MTVCTARLFPRQCAAGVAARVQPALYPTDNAAFSTRQLDIWSAGLSQRCDRNGDERHRRAVGRYLACPAQPLDRQYRFQRWGQPPNNEVADGKVKMGRLEISASIMIRACRKTAKLPFHGRWHMSNSAETKPCDCCADAPAAPQLSNPPGQTALDYRISTYDGFMRRMTAQLGRVEVDGRRPLRDLDDASRRRFCHGRARRMGRCR